MTAHRVTIHGRRALCSCSANVTNRNADWLAWWKAEHQMAHATLAEANEAPAEPAVQFLTVAEVALMLRVSKMTVYRLCESKVLESARIGRSVRIVEKSVTEYLRRAGLAS